jgi:hypothetical protein
LRGSSIALALLATVVSGTGLSAHRLDEYLQAARLAIEPGRVELQLDLTPGSLVAEEIIGDIDRDRSGTLSDDEQRAYVARVLEAIDLRIDGRVLTLTTIAAMFPDLQTFRRGEGAIRLRTSAFVPRLSAGVHELVFHNRHRQDVSAYLANALLPDGDSIEITSQRRDAAQRELAIAYVVRHHAGATAFVWPIAMAGAILLGARVATSRRRKGQVVVAC